MDTSVEDRSRLDQTLRAFMAAYGEDREDVAAVLSIHRKTLDRKWCGTSGASFTYRDLEKLAEHWSVSPLALAGGDLRSLHFVRVRYDRGVTFWYEHGVPA